MGEREGRCNIFFIVYPIFFLECFSVFSTSRPIVGVIIIYRTSRTQHLYLGGNVLVNFFFFPAEITKI